ncbi:MAG: OmpA family protein [Brumimicrobium sp.]
MRFFISFILLFAFQDLSAQDLSGRWSGILMNAGESISEGDVIYLQLESTGNNFSGLSRVELIDNEIEFATKEIKGVFDGEHLTLKDDIIRRSSKTRLSPECKLAFELKYYPESAYLKGKYSSPDCRSKFGEVVFFRANHEVNIEKEPTSTHLWRTFFTRNYEKGYPAPEILKKEQQNFKFETIHFDFDKAEIRPEYKEFLDRMARILDAVHDLRVKITGHTDGEGTDDYNMDLSERRADALRDYFKKRGVEPEKLEIDFKGKRQPVSSNQTKEGRQENRRVVFEFI